MSKGHKGKSPMVMQRTRKLSKIETLMVQEGSAVLNAALHVVVIAPVSAKVKELKDEYEYKVMCVQEAKDAALKAHQIAKREARKIAEEKRKLANSKEAA